MSDLESYAFSCIVLIEKYWRMIIRETMVLDADKDAPLLGLRSRCKI